jgi:hypothetical protein
VPQNPPDKSEKRKLTALSCKEIHRGQGRDGSPYVMYEVEALTEGGQRIGPMSGQALRSFEVLPLNKLVEYEVRVKQTDRHGTTYTLIPPKASTGARLSELERRVQELERQLQEVLKSQPQSDPPAEAPAEPAPGPQTW